MCQCYRVGGPWIAEDPDCPVHGSDARTRNRELDELRKDVQRATTVEELRELLLRIITVVQSQ
jgi:hypothetical protein